MRFEPGAKVTPKIKLVRPLGAGGMGSVWVARHLTLSTEVAVKFVAADKADSDKLRQRFSKEASLAAQIKHPHVVQMFDHGETDSGTPYIVMELLMGQSVAERLATGPLSPKKVGLLIQQVAKVLERAHEMNIVHRDLKPANLYLVDSGFELFVKVLDFGIAKRFVGEEDLKLTDSAAVVGTPHYMSPEALVGREAPDGRADLWSLAVIAYEALTGALPFDGATFAEQTLLVHEGTFESATSRVPGLPPALDGWFRRAFAKDIGDRFSDASELARSWAEATGEEGPSSGRVVVRREDETELEHAVTQTSGALAHTPSAAPARGATLDGAAAISAEPSRRPVLFAVVAVTLLGAAAFLGLRGDAASPAAAVPAEATATASAVEAPTATATADPAPLHEPTTISVVVDSVPPHVEILAGDEVLGRAPGPLVLEPKPVALTFRAPGFQPSTVELTPVEGEPLTIKLTPLRRPPPQGLGDRYTW